MFAKNDIWQVLINPDFTVRATFCPNGDLNNCDKGKIEGKWMNYYDQSL